MATADPIFDGERPRGGNGVRREPRREIVRIVEYACFPRATADQPRRLGFTRDVSRSGMCIGADRSEHVGELLRLSVRGLDGRAQEPVVARVVWTSAERDGRFWLGLELLADALCEDLAA
jgi:hypothetical protein